MKYIFNFPTKNISREEFNEQFSSHATDFIIAMALMNLLFILYLVTRVLTGRLMLWTAFIKAINLTIPLGIGVLTVDGLEELLFFQYSDLKVGQDRTEALVAKVVKCFAPVVGLIIAGCILG